MRAELQVKGDLHSRVREATEAHLEPCTILKVRAFGPFEFRLYVEGEGVNPSSLHHWFAETIECGVISPFPMGTLLMWSES